MKNTKLFGIIMRCAAALLLLCAAVTVRIAAADDGAAASPERHGYTVPVTLADAVDLTVSGDRRVEVEPGGTAVFEVSIPPLFYTLDVLSGGAVWDGKTLTVENVYAPTTVRVRVRMLKYYTLNVICDAECGTVTTDRGNRVLEGDEVYIKIEPRNGYEFRGYSIGAPLASGGELLSEYTRTRYTVNSDADIYANFYVGDAFTLNYDANGGKTDTGLSAKTVYFSNEFYLCPNAVINDGSFVRDGYLLLGYNTAADGSGDFYGCGWNIVMPESGEINLYAVWQKATPSSEFKYTVKGNAVTITGCTSSADMVAVPESIDGLPVTRIAANSLSSLPVKTLVLPRTLLAIDNNAVSGCKSLTTVYMCDSVTSMTDSALSGCDSFSTLNILAARQPTWTSDKHGTYAIKLEQLYTAKNAKLIIVAGSNTAYGLDSVRLRAGLSQDFTPVNFGFNWKVPSVIFIEAASRFIREGDIMLLAPELEAGQWGSCAAYGTMWQLFESCYEIISYIDIRNYTGVLATFASFNKTAANRTPLDYETFNPTVNEYGDYTIYRNGKPDSYAAAPMGRDFSNSTYLKTSFVTRLNAALDMASAAGARVWLTYPAINYNSLTQDSRSEAYRNNFDLSLRSVLHLTVISDINKYIFPGNHYYDSDYHLSTDATNLRTDMLIADLNAMLAKGGTK